MEQFRSRARSPSENNPFDPMPNPVRKARWEAGGVPQRALTYHLPQRASLLLQRRAPGAALHLGGTVLPSAQPMVGPSWALGNLALGS